MPEQEPFLKIAITADLHLTSRKDHPGRYHALENILQQMLEEEIGSIIIAGDLFDESSRNYSEFERLCQNPKFKSIHFHVIPGNHDSRLSNRMISNKNVVVYSEPEIQKFGPMPFLLLPYKKDKSMGEVIASFSSELNPNEWILVGHGDWVEGMREPNPVEPGVYMPLTQMDVESFKPLRAVLGHIHKPMDTNVIHYPGSPCPCDITETGKRRFLIVDSENGEVIVRNVDSDVIYFDESFVVYPVEDEQVYLRNQVALRMERWGIDESEKAKVEVRVKVSGYTSDKRKLMSTLKECFAGISFYQKGEPDISEVSVSDDVERAEIAQRVSRKIRELAWPEDEGQPRKDQMLFEALRVIYGD